MRPSTCLPMLIFAAPFAACGAENEVAPPDPVEPARETVGCYCHMIMIDHEGPKSQGGPK